MIAGSTIKAELFVSQDNNREQRRQNELSYPDDIIIMFEGEFP